MDDTTITVNDSAIPGQLAAAFRQLALGIGAWAIGKGYLSTDTLNSIVTLGLVVIPVAYGQWKRYRDHADKKVMASALPDAVAVIR